MDRAEVSQTLGLVGRIATCVVQDFKITQDLEHNQSNPF